MKHCRSELKSVFEKIVEHSALLPVSFELAVRRILNSGADLNGLVVLKEYFSTEDLSALFGFISVTQWKQIDNLGVTKDVEVRLAFVSSFFKQLQTEIAIHKQCGQGVQVILPRFQESLASVRNENISLESFALLSLIWSPEEKEKLLKRLIPQDRRQVLVLSIRLSRFTPEMLIHQLSLWAETQIFELPDPENETLIQSPGELVMSAIDVLAAEESRLEALHVEELLKNAAKEALVAERLKTEKLQVEEILKSPAEDALKDFLARENPTAFKKIFTD